MGGTITAQRPQFLDDDGRPLTGGMVHFYLAGTTVRRDTYSDSDLLNPNTNPVILDGAGRASIFLTPDVEYRLVVQDSLGTQLWAEDGVATPATVPATTIIPWFGSVAQGRDDAAYPAGFALNDLVAGSAPMRVGRGFVLGHWRIEAVVIAHAVGALTLGMFDLDAESAVPIVEVTRAILPADVQKPGSIVSPEFAFPVQAGEPEYGMKQHGDSYALIYGGILRRLR